MFDLERVESEKEKNEELELFIENLNNDIDIDGLDFMRNIDNYIEENELDKEVVQAINEIKEESVAA